MMKEELWFSLSHFYYFFAIFLVCVIVSSLSARPERLLHSQAFSS